MENAALFQNIEKHHTINRNFSNIKEEVYVESAEQWFDRLYCENMPQMLQLAYRVLRDREAAEDVVQNTFVTLLLKQDEVQSKYANPVGWLYVTLRNQIGNEMQRAKYRIHQPIEDVEGQTVDVDSMDKLEFALPDGLSEADKELLLLVFEQRRTYEEIAEKYGISVLACRTRVFRAKNRVKKLLSCNEKGSSSNNQEEGGVSDV